MTGNSELKASFQRETEIADNCQTGKRLTTNEIEEIVSDKKIQTILIKNFFLSKQSRTFEF